MSDAKFECACGKQCERVPYPRGNRWLCASCGAEWYDMDAAIYKARIKKQVRNLTRKMRK